MPLIRGTVMSQRNMAACVFVREIANEYSDPMKVSEALCMLKSEMGFICDTQSLLKKPQIIIQRMFQIYRVALLPAQQLKR